MTEPTFLLTDEHGGSSTFARSELCEHLESLGALGICGLTCDQIAALPVGGDFRSGHTATIWSVRRIS